MSKTITLYVRPEDKDLFRVAGMVLQPSLSQWIAAKIREELEAIKHKTIAEILTENGKTIDSILGETW